MLSGVVTGRGQMGPFFVIALYVQTHLGPKPHGAEIIGSKICFGRAKLPMLTTEISFYGHLQSAIPLLIAIVDNIKRHAGLRWVLDFVP